MRYLSEGTVRLKGGDPAIGECRDGDMPYAAYPQCLIPMLSPRGHGPTLPVRTGRAHSRRGSYVSLYIMHTTPISQT